MGGVRVTRSLSMTPSGPTKTTNENGQGTTDTFYPPSAERVSVCIGPQDRPRWSARQLMAMQIEALGNL